jgi:hypothetical protein
VVAVVVVNKYQPVRPLSGLLKGTQPVFNLTEVRGDADRVARFCLERTPGDAVFLTPPRFGRFRLVARRAVVSDFKYGMAADSAIIEWRQRLAVCYGDVSSKGFRAAGQMDANFRRISEEKILQVAERYHATYAVLYRATECRFPTLHENKTFKVVSIPAALSVVAFRVSEQQLAEPRTYFRQLVEGYADDVEVGASYVLPVGAGFTVEDAVASYRQAVSEGSLPQLGEMLEPYAGPDPEGIRSVVLFFRTGRRP